MYISFFEKQPQTEFRNSPIPASDASNYSNPSPRRRPNEEKTSLEAQFPRNLEPQHATAVQMEVQTVCCMDGIFQTIFLGISKG